MKRTPLIPLLVLAVACESDVPPPARVVDAYNSLAEAQRARILTRAQAHPLWSTLPGRSDEAYAQLVSRLPESCASTTEQQSEAASVRDDTPLPPPQCAALGLAIDWTEPLADRVPANWAETCLVYERCAPVLDLLDQAVRATEGGGPYDLWLGADLVDQHVSLLFVLQRVGHLSALASAEGPDALVRTLVRDLHLARDVASRATLIGAMVSVAIANTSLTRLQETLARHATDLSPERLRQLLTALQLIDAQQVPFTEVIDAERLWIMPGVLPGATLAAPPRNVTSAANLPPPAPPCDTEPTEECRAFAEALWDFWQGVSDAQALPWPERLARYTELQAALAPLLPEGEEPFAAEAYDRRYLALLAQLRLTQLYVADLLFQRLLGRPPASVGEIEAELGVTVGPDPFSMEPFRIEGREVAAPTADAARAQALAVLDEFRERLSVPLIEVGEGSAEGTGPAPGPGN